MTGGSCVACAAVHFPAVPVCPECGGASEAVALETAGRVETWTTIHRAQPGEEVPYTLAWIWTAQGLRILARWSDPEPPSAGARAELSFEPDERILARRLAEAPA